MLFQCQIEVFRSDARVTLAQDVLVKTLGSLPQTFSLASRRDLEPLSSWKEIRDVKHSFSWAWNEMRELATLPRVF